MSARTMTIKQLDTESERATSYCTKTQPLMLSCSNPRPDACNNKAVCRRLLQMYFSTHTDRKVEFGKPLRAKPGSETLGRLAGLGTIDPHPTEFGNAGCKDSWHIGRQFDNEAPPTMQQPRLQSPMFPKELLLRIARFNTALSTTCSHHELIRPTVKFITTIK